MLPHAVGDSRGWLSFPMVRGDQTGSKTEFLLSRSRLSMRSTVGLGVVGAANAFRTRVPEFLRA